MDHSECIIWKRSLYSQEHSVKYIRAFLLEYLTMTFLLWIFLTLLVFFIVVFIHEMGHFLISRMSWVKVQEFGIGIPPRLRRLFRDKRGTEWTLNWLPLWGFVRLKWEDISAPESRDRDALPQARWWKQVAILLAGVFMNFLLSSLLFASLFFFGTEPLTLHIREMMPNALLSHVGNGTHLIPIFDTLEQAENAGVIKRYPGIILDPLPGSIALESGIHSGDIALTVDDIEMLKAGDFSRIVSTYDRPHKIRLMRDGQEMVISVTPSRGKIGAYVAPNIVPVHYQYWMLSSLYHWGFEVLQQISFSFRTFGAIFHTSFSGTASRAEKQEATAGIGWPVAIGRVFVGLAGHGVDMRAIVIMTAMISLSLWVFNLLPFPALDGGRCLIVLVNQVIHVINPRFKISPKIEQLIHSIGFMLLIFASILITWKDIFFHN